MDQWIDQERDEDLPEIDRLLDTAFGPGREARTAYRFRNRASPVRDLGFVMRSGSALLGSVRFWPLLMRPAQGAPSHALLLGPLVVLPELRGTGIGIALLKHGLAAVKGSETGPVFLIGDLPYYSRAGFRPVLPSLCSMPGPVEPERVLFWDGEQSVAATTLPECFALEPVTA